ncbi:TRAP transporter small permease subunit [Marivita sp. GX14005]|uniref:TRAP transporter small permease subunit n=1 Tax=Marivita sp. GX14005 TaxID=2942276 RepID=UPI00201960CC|nr:TRAP transporter small permease subunit [Marivita sp. GX14005]MCL3883607.1 C4-dicarboxylate ABC transporter permease [Marivita sp. GX14005]
MDEAATGPALTGVLDAILWVARNIALSFYNLGYAVTHLQSWLDWSDKEAVMRFVYYGASVEFLFVVLTAFLVIAGIGFWNNRFMWGCVRGLEGFANTIGRFFAWAGLIMVIQQVMIVFLQRIFTRPDITIGFGIPLRFDISWWSEELKLYNALVIVLCLAYTFIQGGHVRVDLVYSKLSHRAKRMVDMIGSLIFMMPMAILIWLYAWFFMWRHLIVPNPSASESLDRLLMKSRALRWNVETIGFSPSGFNGYFLFKILLVILCAMIFLQAVAFFFRSYLEWKEGEASAGRYLDRDRVEPSETPFDHAEF